MMALQLLPIFQVIIILCTPLLAYPVYGTKSQSYPDEYYYPQESAYPVYYPARTSKYEVYQAVLPYYYQERRPNYKYYSYNDPVVNLQEEMIQEAEREQREDAQPIGHEMLYENDEENAAGLEDVNAAFLQNLIMSQMYQDAYDNQNQNQNYRDDLYYDEEAAPELSEDDLAALYQEDKDVKELRQLAAAKPLKQKPRKLPPPIKHEDVHWFQKNNYRNQKNDYKRNERKSNVKAPSTTKVPIIVQPKQTPSPRRDTRGQKEEVLMRPATPVRHPFSSSVLQMMSKNQIDTKRAPSVYDTIKHMLDMEKSLENKQANEGKDGEEGMLRPNMKKRIISSEESLTHQLSVLKKTQ